MLARRFPDDEFQEADSEASQDQDGTGRSPVSKTFFAIKQAFDDQVVRPVGQGEETPLIVAWFLVDGLPTALVDRTREEYEQTKRLIHAWRESNSGKQFWQHSWSLIKRSIAHPAIHGLIPLVIIGGIFSALIAALGSILYVLAIAAACIAIIPVGIYIAVEVEKKTRWVRVSRGWERKGFVALLCGIAIASIAIIAAVLGLGIGVVGIVLGLLIALPWLLLAGVIVAGIVRSFLSPKDFVKQTWAFFMMTVVSPLLGLFGLMGSAVWAYVDAWRYHPRQTAAASFALAFVVTSALLLVSLFTHGAFLPGLYSFASLGAVHLAMVNIAIILICQSIVSIMISRRLRPANSTAECRLGHEVKDENKQNNDPKYWQAKSLRGLMPWHWLVPLSAVTLLSCAMYYGHLSFTGALPTWQLVLIPALVLVMLQAYNVLTFWATSRSVKRPVQGMKDRRPKPALSALKGFQPVQAGELQSKESQFFILVTEYIRAYLSHRSNVTYNALKIFLNDCLPDSIDVPDQIFTNLMEWLRTKPSGSALPVSGDGLDSLAKLLAAHTALCVTAADQDRPGATEAKAEKPAEDTPQLPTRVAAIKRLLGAAWAEAYNEATSTTAAQSQPEVRVQASSPLVPGSP